LPKITLLWVTDPDKPFKVFSFKKKTAYFLLGSFVFFCLATLILSSSTWMFHNELSQAKQQKNRLQNKLTSFENDIDRLKNTISDKKESINGLENKLSHSKKQLKQIQQMELKIRNYLGLDKSAPKNKDQSSHQGAFRHYNSTSQYNSRILENEHKNKTGFKQNIVPYSMSLKDNLDEVLIHLEEKDNKLSNIPSILPVTGENIWLSCDYEWRNNPFTSKKEFHSAIDIAGAHKTPLIAPADGTVIKASKNKIWGNYVRIRHNDKLTTAYGHMSSKAVSRGDKVERRDVIGYMGSTGHSTGTHVHYKVIKNGRHTDPMQYVLDRKANSLKLKEKYEQMAEK